MNLRKRLKDAWHVLAIAAVLIGAEQLYYYTTADPAPYKDVVVESVELVEDGYLITATFTKNQCEFKRLEVFGVTLKTLELLDWHSTEADPTSGESYDRSAGFQVLIIIAETDHGKYTELEIRTRHDCDGETVDKLFATIQI